MKTKPIIFVLCAVITLGGCASSPATKLVKDNELDIHLSQKAKAFLDKPQAEQDAILAKREAVINGKRLQRFNQQELQLDQPVMTGAPGAATVTKFNPVTGAITQSEERVTGVFGAEITSVSQLRGGVDDKDQSVKAIYQENVHTGVETPVVIQTGIVTQDTMQRMLVDNITLGAGQGTLSALIQRGDDCDGCGGVNIDNQNSNNNENNADADANANAKAEANAKAKADASAKAKNNKIVNNNGGKKDHHGKGHHDKGHDKPKYW